MPSPPDLSDEQRASALIKAAAVRAERVALRAKLASGELTLAGALERIESDDAIANIKVLALLESLPGVGKVKARRIMEQLEIAPSRRMRGLGPRQRTALLTARD
jgi:DNA uptake protein ComE-like DNA-binding protein